MCVCYCVCVIACVVLYVCVFNACDIHATIYMATDFVAVKVGLTMGYNSSYHCLHFGKGSHLDMCFATAKIALHLHCITCVDILATHPLLVLHKTLRCNA